MNIGTLYLNYRKVYKSWKEDTHNSEKLSALFDNLKEIINENPLAFQSIKDEFSQLQKSKSVTVEQLKEFHKKFKKEFKKHFQDEVFIALMNKIIPEAVKEQPNYQNLSALLGRYRRILSEWGIIKTGKVDSVVLNFFKKHMRLFSKSDLIILTGLDPLVSDYSYDAKFMADRIGLAASESGNQYKKLKIAPTISPLLKCAKEDSEAFDKWLEDKPEDIEAVKKIIENFKNEQLTYDLVLANYDKLIEPNIKILLPIANEFNARREYYENDTKQLEITLLLIRAGALLSIGATEPAALQLSLSSNADLADGISKLISNIQANEMAALLEALSEIHENPAKMHRFLHGNKGITEKLLENKAKLLKAANLLEKTDLTDNLLKIRHVIITLLTDPTSLNNNVTQRDQKFINKFTQYFSSLDKKLSRGNTEEKISAIFLREVNEMDKNPGLLQDYLKTYPEIRKFLTDNSSSLFRIADYITVEPACARPSPLQENTFNFTDALQAITTLLTESELTNVISDEQKYTHAMKKMKYINDNEGSTAKEVKEKVASYKQQLHYKALVEFKDKIISFSKAIYTDIGREPKEIGADILLLSTFLKLQALSTNQLQLLSLSCEEKGGKFQDLIGCIDSEATYYSCNLQTVSTAIIGYRSELKVSAIHATEPEALIQALKTFLKKIYNKEVGAENINSLSKKQIISSIYANLIRELSANDINKLQKLVCETDASTFSGENHKIWEGFQESLKMARVQLSIINPYHPDNPFNKPNISFNTKFIINKVFNDAYFDADQEATDKQIKQQLNEQLISKLSYLELKELSEAIKNFKTEDPLWKRFPKCFNKALDLKLAEVESIREHCEKKVLKQLATDIKNLQERANTYSFIFRRDKTIALQKIAVLSDLKKKITDEKEKLITDSTDPINESIENYKKGCEQAIDNALKDSHVNTHCNLLKAIVEKVVSVIQWVKSSFMSLFSLFSGRSAQSVKNKGPYQYCGLFKTNTHTKLEGLRDNITPKLEDANTNSRSPK